MITQAGKTTAALLAVLAAAAITPAAQAQVTRQLTPAEVSCNASQLTALVFRTGLLVGPNFASKSITSVLTFGSPTGAFAGLVYSDQLTLRAAKAATPEHHLWFSTNPDEVKLLRNPARPQLDSISMTRNDLNSDLVTFNDADSLAVSLDPTLDPTHNTNDSTKLIIDDVVLNDGGVPADTKPGRGLAGIVDSCHGDFTAADLHVLAVLAKTLRVTAYDTTSATPGFQLVDQFLALYRGANAVAIAGGVRTTYLADVYPAGTDFQRVSASITVDLGSDGTLGNSTLQILPACANSSQTGCTFATSEVRVFVVKPVGAGQFWNTSGNPTACVGSPGGSGCASQVSFSWGERLAGTTWLKPL
ncbi:MAG TPA: hypothetical protein VFE33_22565 [Thermoanaerobaculia bacterium]|nr:hypothetical protein [Thermoanaerobaculia bacterium]